MASLQDLGIGVSPGDNRPPVYEEDGRTIFRASAVGGCLQKMLYALSGVTPESPPDFMQQAFDAGHQMEDEVIAKLMEESGAELVDPEDHGYQTTGESKGQIEAEITWGKNAVRCHPDGLAIHEGELVVVEVKYLGPDLFKKLTGPAGIRGMASYSWQAAIEHFSCGGLPILYGMALKNTAEIKKGKPPEILDFKWKVIRKPPHSLSAIKKRCALVTRAAREDVELGCDQKSFPCGFWQLHDKSKGSVWYEGATVKIDDEKKRELLAEAAGFNAKARELEKEAKEFKASAKQAWTKAVGRRKLAGGDRIEIDGWKISYVSTERTGSIDIHQLAEDLGLTEEELDKYRGPTTTTAYPRYTQKKDS